MSAMLSNSTDSEEDPPRERIDTNEHGASDDLQGYGILESSAHGERVERVGKDTAELVLEEGDLKSERVLSASVGRLRGSAKKVSSG